MRTREESDWNWLYEQVESERIDKFLAAELGESRSQIQHWLKEGYIQVNDQLTKPNYKLQKNDQLTITLPPQQGLEIKPEKMALDIVYEDDDLLVINKPKGMVVHPAPGHYSGTLVNGLLAYCQLSDMNGLFRQGIVHRLDKDTSGLLIVAKHNQAHQGLAEQLQEHKIIREYVALVHGHVAHERGTIEAPIGRDPNNRQQMTVIAGGKEATTHFTVRERYEGYTLLDLQLETGRTHQIRVHMKYIGHPVAGDPKYGPAKTLALAGQALHAQRLTFTHPLTGEKLCLKAPIPMAMQKEIDKLKREITDT